MPKLNQKGLIVHSLLLLALLGGIIAGIYLVQKGNLKLFSRASQPPIVFKSSSGQALSNNSSGMPQTSSPSIKIELTSTLGAPVYSTPVPSAIPTPSPTPTPTPTPAPTSTPVITPSPSPIAIATSYPAGIGATNPIGIGTTVRVLGVGTSASNNIPIQTGGTVSFKIAETPAGLDTAGSVAYTSEPTTIDYTFKDLTAGTKFIWVEFKDVSGKTDRRSAQVELMSATGGIQTGRSLACENYGDLNLDGKITKDDADMALQIFLGKINANSSGKEYMRVVGDVDDNEKVDTTDAQIIQQYLDGKTSTFPVCAKSKLSPCNNLGDVTGDGKISKIDAQEVLNIVVGNPNSIYTGKPYTAEQKKNADVNGDGQISSLDALLIKRYLLGMDKTFKGCLPQVPVSVFGKAIKLSGQDYVTYAATKNDNTACSFGTLQMWIKMDQSNLKRGTNVISKIGNFRGFDLSTNGSGTLAFYMYGKQFFTNTPLTPDKWYHIAIVKDFYYPTSPDRRGIYIYVNGKVDGFRKMNANGASVSGLDNYCERSNGALRIGNSSLGFIGQIDEINFDSGILYTSQFTPPSKPLVGGSIILHFDNSLQDTGINKFAGDAYYDIPFVDSTVPTK